MKTNNNQPNSQEPESKTPRADKAKLRAWTGNKEEDVVRIDDARILELELEKAKKTLPLNNESRLVDLVRHQRAELHRVDLITDDEYSELASLTDSPKRLMEYDQLRQQLSAVTKERDEARATISLLASALSDYTADHGIACNCSNCALLARVDARQQ